MKDDELDILGLYPPPQDPWKRKFQLIGRGTVIGLIGVGLMQTFASLGRLDLCAIVGGVLLLTFNLHWDLEPYHVPDRTVYYDCETTSRLEDGYLIPNTDPFGVFHKCRAKPDTNCSSQR